MRVFTLKDIKWSQTLTQVKKKYKFKNQEDISSWPFDNVMLLECIWIEERI